MKLSEITVEDLISYAREDQEDQEVIKIFNTILLVSKAFIKNYTGLTIEEMDLKEDLIIVLMALSNEMYENRMFTIENEKINPVIKALLDMHSVNLL
ncbi:MAG: phage gp6-like head-tail connector protein [Clostridium sp.]|nr:phage gp6-like head-tail connector protein [Clostridium sp.]